MADVIAFLSGPGSPVLEGRSFLERVVLLALRALYLRAFPSRTRRVRRPAFVLY